MALRRYSNVAVITALNGGISAIDTSLTVQNVTGYPAVPFSIEIDNEVILVNSVSANVFTSVTRGFDGTAAAAHADTAQVEHVAIADDFNHRWQELILEKPRAADDDEFDLDAIDSVWNERTVSGTATWTQGNGSLSTLFNTQGANEVAALIKPISHVSPVTLETAVRLFGQRDEDPLYAGLILTDGISNTSNVALAHLSQSAGTWTAGQANGLQNAWTNDATETVDHLGFSLYLRLKWTTSNTFISEFSPDGVSWTPFGFTTFTKVMVPTYAGMFVSSSGGSVVGRIATFEYFRLDAT